MRFGFVTCVQLGLSCMEEIYRIGGELELAITLPDEQATQKSGRIFLDDFCRLHSLPLLKSANVNDAEVLEAVREREIDWLFIIGWSQIAGTELLAVPKRGALGMHPTLLPRGRGRASIPWAILKGLDRTGVTLFQIDEGVDTGPVLAHQVLSLSARETATTLYRRVEEAHRALISASWPKLVADKIVLEPQDERASSYWPGRRPEDGRIRPGRMKVLEIDRLVRAVTRPYPGAFLDDEASGQRLRVWAGSPMVPALEGNAAYTITAIDGTYVVLDAEWE